MEKSNIKVETRQEGDVWYVDVIQDGKVVQSVPNKTKGNANFNKEAILRAFANNNPEATLRFLAESY